MDFEGGRGPATAPSTEIIDGLNDLLQLDHDALGGYDIAIEKLEDRDHASQISGFRMDHERHIRELNELIAELGGTPTNEPHATGPLKQAMQSLGALAGDRGTLIAWRANELQVRAKYDSYASRANRWPENVKRVIDQAALDEERHYHWVANVLQQMGVGAGEGLEIDLLNKLRERGNQAGHAIENLGDRAKERAGELGERARERAGELGERARERVGSALGTARLRTADGLERAADRLEEMASEADGQPRLGGAAHRVADGMDGTADYLRTADGERVRSDLEGMVRANPARTLLGTFAVGFVIGRILR
jgi:rubrerythrin